MDSAFISGKYRNVLAENGCTDAEIQKLVDDTFNTMFFGADDERIYFPVGSDMGQVRDTGSVDVRTEGMSYGMMMCVQLDKKEVFDRLWKWTMTYMFMEDGENAGYFCWSNGYDGKKNSGGPAPDGEEYFAAALIFAANRWGNGSGIFDYMTWARAILHTMLHKGENDEKGKPMFNRENHLVKFVTDREFSDPSYHLPHFYEIFALYADESDRDFWKQAAAASREYLKLACHPMTGLCGEYADYDGTPHDAHNHVYGRHDWYYSDAYRTVMNVALDYSWFKKDENEVTIANNVQKFFCETVRDNPDGIYLYDGTVVEGKAKHPTAIIASNAMASLAADGIHSAECVRRFLQTPLRQGKMRYYDNCLYLFALLALSGNYRIY